MPEQNDRSSDVLKRFDFNVNITKAWIKKGEDGKEDQYFVRAIASDTGVDHHGERFSEKAIDGMIGCIKNNSPQTVVLLPTHWDTFEIGKAIAAKKIDSPTHSELKALEVDIELFVEYQQAKSLYKEVESGNPEKQLSVGGYLNPDNDEPYFWEKKEYEAPDGNVLYDYILVLDDIVLDHIAVTRKDHAANPRTSFTGTIAKSLGIKKPEINKEVEEMSKADKQAHPLIDQITKSIKEFFKSNDAENQKIEAAKNALEKAKEALKDLEGVEFNADELGIKDLQDTFTSYVKSEDNSPETDEKAVDTEKSSDENPEDKGDANATPAAEELKSTDINVDELKSTIIGDLTKSFNESQQQTFKEIANSLGAVVAETIKSQVKPLQDKIEELEKFSGKSKSLDGQDDLRQTVKAKGNDEEEGDLWAGIIKSAIPQHIIIERKYEQGEE